MSKISDNVVQLALLDKEYDELMLSYKSIYDEYIASLRESAQTLLILKSSKYNGLQNLSQQVTANENECKTLCSSTKLCNGANYSSSTKNCSLFSNATYSSISQGSDNEFAIYSNIKELNHKLNEINLKLLEKNKAIFTLIKDSESGYNKTRSEMTTLTQTLENNYKTLYDEKQKINNLLDEFETYIEKDVSTKTEANRNYIIYILLFFILIILLVILIKTLLL